MPRKRRRGAFMNGPYNPTSGRASEPTAAARLEASRAADAYRDYYTDVPRKDFDRVFKAVYKKYGGRLDAITFENEMQKRYYRKH